jgi:hypothetical protein
MKIVNKSSLTNTTLDFAITSNSVETSRNFSNSSANCSYEDALENSATVAKFPFKQDFFD